MEPQFSIGSDISQTSNGTAKLLTKVLIGFNLLLLIVVTICLNYATVAILGGAQQKLNWLTLVFWFLVLIISIFDLFALYYGFYGAFIKSIRYIRRFVVFSLITILFSSILALFLWFSQNEAKIDFGKGFISKKLKHSHKDCSEVRNAAILNKSLDQLQQDFKCCGWDPYKGFQQFIDEMNEHNWCVNTTILLWNQCCINVSQCNLRDPKVEREWCQSVFNRWPKVIEYTPYVLLFSLYPLFILNLIAIYLRRELILLKKTIKYSEFMSQNISRD